MNSLGDWMLAHCYTVAKDVFSTLGAFYKNVSGLRKADLKEYAPCEVRFQSQVNKHVQVKWHCIWYRE